MNRSDLHPRALALVKQKYNILLELDARDFDTNWQILSDKLDSVKKEKFSANDRILIVHMDTAYYDELLPYGLLIINLLRMFKNKDIPLYMLLFVTNHYGIQKEFDSLLSLEHSKDRPTIIETLLSRWHFSHNLSHIISESSCNIDQIEKAGLSMMRNCRSHRVALVNFIVDSNLLDHIALTTNFTK